MKAVIRFAGKIYGFVVRVDGEDIFQTTSLVQAIAYCKARNISFIISSTGKN